MLKLMILVSALALAATSAIAADCPYDADQKEAIRQALGFIPCALDPVTATRVLIIERVKTRARDLHPGNSAKQWEYIYQHAPNL